MMNTHLVPGFTLLKQLGQGSYGTVYKAKRASDGKNYALKVVDMGALNQKQREDSINEIRIMASVTSPFIIAFHEASVVGRRLVIVSEYAKLGDLAHAISRRKQKRRPFKEDTIWRFLLQMLEGLRVLHDRGIVHRDLKSANIMLSAPDLYKIGDLGISTVLAQRQLAKTQIGTPMYLAPEIWKNRPYDSKCDIWSLGVLMYEMATFQYPYNARNARDLSVKVCSAKPPRISSSYSKDLVNVIMMMLNQNPILRPSVKDLLNLPSVKAHFNLIQFFMPAVEQSHAELLDTIKVPRNLQALNLPRPRYEKEECIFIPIEGRLHVKGNVIKSQKKLSLVSTRELQMITDLDCWSPMKKKPLEKEERPDPDELDDDIPKKEEPRVKEEPKQVESKHHPQPEPMAVPREPSRPSRGSSRPKPGSAQRNGGQRVATPPVEPPPSHRPRVMRFRFRQPLVIR